MAMRVATNPLQAPHTVLPENGLDGAGEALHILIDEVAEIESAEFLGASAEERTTSA